MTDLSPEERQYLIEKFKSGDYCPECGGYHLRACPRIQKYAMRYKPENPELVLERQVEFWPPGSWEEGIIFPEDVYDEDPSSINGKADAN